MWEKELEVALLALNSVRQPIMDIYSRDFDVEIKDDSSPVTEADKMVDKMLRDFISEKFPTHSFLTEESSDDLSRLDADYLWIIDPIDGTKNFVDKDDQFTVNIALAYKNKLVVGAILIPVTNEIYYGSRRNGAFYSRDEIVDQIYCNRKTSDLTAFVSKHHRMKEEDEIIEKYSDRISKTASVGSSIKLCRIAHGVGEITYRFSGNTKEWDTAAGQCILEAAGGVMITLKQEELQYNKKDPRNADGYIAANRRKNILL